MRKDHLKIVLHFSVVASIILKENIQSFYSPSVGGFLNLYIIFTSSWTIRSLPFVISFGIGNNFGICTVGYEDACALSSTMAIRPSAKEHRSSSIIIGRFNCQLVG